MELRSGNKLGQNILPIDRRPVFEEGVNLICARWTALCLAVENQWGGSNSREKAAQLVLDTIQWFYKRKEHYADDLMELLDDAIAYDFNVQAEDDSPMQVAQALVSLYQDCLKGDFSSIERMRAVNPAGAAKSQKQVVDYDGTVMEADEDDDSSSSASGNDGDDCTAMDADMEPPSLVPAAMVPNPGPVIDEEGFQLVTRGRKNRP